MQTKELFAFWKGGATKRMRDDFLMRSIKSRREAAQSATTRASIAFWYQKAACRENPDPEMPPAGGERSAVRKNQYNLHIRLDEDERAALEKGLQASGLPLSAYLRKLILGESIQAAPSEELRRLRTEIHQIGNNINQLARKANAGFASQDEITRALRMLDRVYELMYQLSQQSWQ